MDISCQFITSHHIMPYVKNYLGILFCKREILASESTMYTDYLQQTCKRKREHFNTLGGTLEDRLCKKKATVCSLHQVHIHEVGW